MLIAVDGKASISLHNETSRDPYLEKLLFSKSDAKAGSRRIKIGNICRNGTVSYFY